MHDLSDSSHNSCYIYYCARPPLDGNRTTSPQVMRTSYQPTSYVNIALNFIMSKHFNRQQWHCPSGQNIWILSGHILDTRWIVSHKYLEKLQTSNLSKRQLAINYPNSIRIISNILCLESFKFKFFLSVGYYLDSVYKVFWNYPESIRKLSVDKMNSAHISPKTVHIGKLWHWPKVVFSFLLGSVNTYTNTM